MRGARHAVSTLLLAMALAACSGTAIPTPSRTLPPTPFPSPLVTPSPTPEGAGVTAMLADAVKATLATGSVGLDMGVDFTGSSSIPEGTGMSAKGSMAFDASRHARLEMDMTDLGAGTFGYIQDGEVMYLRFDGTLASLVPDGKWVRIDETSHGQFATTFKDAMSGPNDSTILIYYLLGATGEGRVVGTEEIGDVTTTRVRAQLDLDLALDRMPAAVHDAMVVNIYKMSQQGMDPTLTAEAWIGDDGLIYRQRLVYPLAAKAGGGQMVVLTTFADHGTPVDLKIPDEKDVIAADDVVMPTG
jgi:hypothetical protein